MRQVSTTALAIVIAILAFAAPAGGEEPTRESYVTAVDPICKRDREAGERILDGTREDINRGRLTLAGRALIHASERLGVTIKQLVAVPRPPADEAKLQKWFRFLRILRERIRQTGKLYKEGERIEATHESIRAERSGNAANNVSFAFGFRYCRLSRSRFN